MVPELRKKFNAEFTDKAYRAFVQELDTTYRYPLDFRVSETPLFLSEEITRELISAGDLILATLQSKEFTSHASTAVPPAWNVPRETAHPAFLQLDFAICQNDSGEFSPQLIELQGFPSLYCYQAAHDAATRHNFRVPSEYGSYFGGLTFETYLGVLRNLIVGARDPSSVVLLEVDPERQKTRIDFACTEKMLGIPTLDLVKIIKKGRKLSYERDGKEFPIERIYNRVIVDDLEKKKVQSSFKFTDDMDAEWVGHPNWFYRISKHTLPFLKNKYVPPCVFLDDLRSLPDDLGEYVLKPLYSFAGSGVKVDLTRADLDAISDRHSYILQKKVTYAPLVQTPDGYAMAEVRMMYVWETRPLLVNNLVRMSKGKMMGVAFNKDKTWVGSSIAYHP